MNKKIRATKRTYTLIGVLPEKKISKRKIICYSNFRDQLIAKGVNINIKYIFALENDSSILSHIIQCKDYDLIERIIMYYTVKSVNSSTTSSASEVTLSRFNEFKENIHLFENLDLFCHGKIITYLSGKFSLLELVIHLNDYHLAKQLIEQGADVNAIPYLGQSLLHQAIYQENKDIFKLLLENNANPNVKDSYEESVFFRAVKRNDYELAEYLIKAGARVDDPSAEFSPLQWAISKRNHKMTDFIIENGGDVNLVCCGKTPLHYAVDVENDDMIHLLIKNKADINATTCVERNETALGTAIKKHNLNLIKTVISVGADVNLFSRYVTPLQFAIIKSNYNSFQIVEHLIKSGAEVNADSSPESKYFGQKALHIAVQKGNEQLTRLLIKNNADIEAVTKSGQTALGIAVQNENFELVEALVEADVDVNKFSAGIAPLNLAIAAKNYKIFKYLIDYGADINDVIANGSNEELKSSFDLKKLIQVNIVMFKAADFKISAVNLPAISGSEFYDLFAKCYNEVTLMKTINVGTTTLTYYDTLHTSIHRMAMRFKYVDDNVICHYRNLKLKLPIYADILHGRLKKTIIRKKLLKKSSDVISDIFYRELPNTFIRELLWYLTNRDLRILTGCFNDQLLFN